MVQQISELQHELGQAQSSHSKNTLLRSTGVRLITKVMDLVEYVLLSIP